ncbi:HIRAN domain-containing protein [Isoptericola sp. NPDC057391]|uniref:HIRAN domain-containing protein n=1 Tax=Isoptericola sp. NPDC057391 TaxID=3346117 RepID=UPI00362E5565
MSLREWLGRRRSPRTAGALRTTPANPSSPTQRPTLTIRLSGAPLVKLAGTTTFCAEAAHGLVRRRGLAGRGLLEEAGVLEREPSNASDPNAVAVLVEGERIGYLPAGAAGSLLLDERTARAVPLQLAYLVEGETARVEAWVWLGEDLPPRWQYTAENLPPMTPQDKRTSVHLARREMVAEALAGGGDRAKTFEAGMVSGVHYLELVEPIKQLKRDNRLEEALELCYAAIQGAEGDRAGSTPAPWYTEQAAIIHRKLRQPEREAAVLERWLAFVPVEQRASTKLGQRLAKLKN